MVEYILDVIRATAGQDIEVAVKVKDENGNPVKENCGLMLHSKEKLLETIVGTYIEEEELWLFTIPAAATKGLKGRYYYCVMQGDKSLCFKKPLYLL